MFNYEFQTPGVGPGGEVDSSGQIPYADVR